MIKEKILFDFSVRFNIKANKTFVKISGTHATSWRKRFNFHTFENKYISFLTVYSICTFIDLYVPTMLICLSHVQHMMSKPYLDQHFSIQNKNQFLEIFNSTSFIIWWCVDLSKWNILNKKWVQSCRPVAVALD